MRSMIASRYVVKNVEAAMKGKSDGRMYSILDDKFVTRHADGRVTALTRGHRIEIEASGNFSIFNWVVDCR